jgi:uncharacterized protein YdhG (YjbR/CyaY superfamily)
MLPSTTTPEADAMTDIPEHLASYLAGFPAEVQRLLRAVHQTIRQAAPDAKERFSYGMPAFFQHGAVAYFGAFKHHIGLFPPVVDAALRERAAAYCGPKGNLQFPLDQPIPHALIAEIVRARLHTNLAKPARS